MDRILKPPTTKNRLANLSAARVHSRRPPEYSGTPVPQLRGRRRGAAGGKVRVAIIGVGNCASSLVQGVEFYRNADERESVPGLMHVNLGGYHVRDIEFSA